MNVLLPAVLHLHFSFKFKLLSDTLGCFSVFSLTNAGQTWMLRPSNVETNLCRGVQWPRSSTQGESTGFLRGMLSPPMYWPTTTNLHSRTRCHWYNSIQLQSNNCTRTWGAARWRKDPCGPTPVLHRSRPTRAWPKVTNLNPVQRRTPSCHRCQGKEWQVPSIAWSVLLGIVP